MAKRTLKSEAMTLTTTTIDVALVTAALTSIGLLTGGWSFVVSLLLAGTAVPVWQFARRNLPQPGYQSPRRQWRQMASTVDDYLNPIYDDEFYFRGLGLAVPIPESTFARFVSIARRRQTRALYPDNTLHWTGRSYQRIKSNWILSEDYFTSEIRPRFLTDEYKSCKEILGYTRLLICKGQGDAGRLKGNMGEGWYVTQARARWQALTERPTPRYTITNLMPKITTSRS